MNIRTITPAEFAAEFPRARAGENAASYAIVEHHPREFVDAGSVECPEGHQAVVVGYTNTSRSKKVTRIAFVPMTTVAYDDDAVQGIGIDARAAIADAARNGATCTMTAEVDVALAVDIIRNGWNGFTDAFDVTDGRLTREAA